MLQINLFPRTCLSITVQQLNDDGNLKSAAINAVCLALLDAGLPMKCTFVAVCVVLTSDNQLIVRPTAKQKNMSIADFTFVFYSNEPNNIAGCLSEGIFSLDTFKKAASLGMSSASEMFSAFRRSIRSKLIRQFDISDDLSLISV